MATLKRKIEHRFFEKKLNPGGAVERFIVELDIVLRTLQDVSMNKQQQFRQHRQQQQQTQKHRSVFLTMIS